MVVIGLVVTAAGGCARARARTAPEQPALETPPPPPRVIQPLGLEALDPAGAAGAEAEDRRPAGEKPPAGDRARTDDRAKPDPRRDTPPAKVEGPVEGPKPAPPEPPRTLETTAPGAQGAVERQVRGLLRQAGQDLNNVEYGALSTDGRTQYDTSKRFIEQANQALEERNLVYAAKLADKAATLARSLVKR